MPRVAHAEHGVATFVRQRDLDLSARVGVLRRVVDQVAEHLRQAREVAADARSAVGGSLTVSVCCCASTIGRLVSTAAETTSAASSSVELELDLAARDPRQVEQVVDEARELLQLPPDDVACPSDLLGLRRRRP